MRVFLVVLSLICLEPALAQVKTQTSAPKPKPARRVEFRTGYLLWQEAIDLKNGPSNASMRAQGQGILTSLSRTSPLSRRWLLQYGGDFAVGSLKGKGNSAAIADELSGQLWYSLGAHLGAIYRTSSVTNLGLLVPAHYRMIQWKLKGGSSLDPDRDTSYSVGLGAIMENRLSARSWVHFAVTHQHMWNATMFAFSWKYTL